MITACFITLNEGKNLKECMEHLKGTIDTFLVVDNHSTDTTLDVARSYGANIVTHVFEDFASQRNVALEHVTTDWTLMIDPDERCSDKLLSSMQQLTKEPHDAYKVHWKNYCGDKLIVTPWKTILFKSFARFGGELHERITNIPTKHEIADEDIFITHHKTLEEQLRHLTKYRSIITGLFLKSNGTDERLDYLINDHNANVKAWLGKDYEYLLLSREELSHTGKA